MSGIDRLGRYNVLVNRGALHTTRTELWLSPDLLAALNEAANMSNVTRAELIRTYITWGLDTDAGTWK